MKSSGDGLIKDYMSGVFDKSGVMMAPLLQKVEIVGKRDPSQKFLYTKSVSEDYSINERKQEEDEEAGEQNDVVNSYQEPDHDAIISQQRPHDDGIHSEAGCMHSPSPNYFSELDPRREQLPKEGTTARESAGAA